MSVSARSWSSAADHEHPEGGVDVAVEPDRHLVQPDRADRLGELDDATIQLDAFASERFGDVAVGDRPEELVVLTGLAADRDRGVGAALGELLWRTLPSLAGIARPWGMR